jgi:hypothetical protein
VTQVDPRAILGPALPGTAPAPGDRAAARRFEAFVLERLLEPATRPLLAGGLLDGGSAGALGRQLHLAELARIAAARGGIGLADALAGAAGAGAPRDAREEETR